MMRHSEDTSKRKALMAVMNATYEDIRRVEMEHGLRVGGSDFRPRIEYFQDALRVLSQSPEQMYQPRTRLSVEHLAYDMSCLRYIQDRPLAKLETGTPAPHTSSQGAAVAALPPQGQPAALPPPAGCPMERVSQPKPVPPTVRAVLTDYYRTYTVMYAAVFAETADINFQTRVTQNDTGVEDLAHIRQLVKMAEEKTVSPERVEEAILHLEDTQIRDQLIALFHRKALRRKEEEALQQLIDEQMSRLDMETRSLDKAHMSFLTGQMVMLHEAKDLVRKLSGQGLGMAGQFLENAMSQAAGRGQGYGR